jgi:hypothetical protein
MFNSRGLFLTDFQWLCQFFVLSRCRLNYLNLTIPLTDE